MKQYWHTWTLFIRAWKYKWSYKYDHCIQCKTCDHKHKWRWLCTSCWDKERNKNPKRKETHRVASMKWKNKNNPKKPREEWKKRWNNKQRTMTKQEYQKVWYQRWKEAIIILNKWKIWKNKWKILPEYQWYPIPFDIWPRNKEESYEEYKERMRKFDAVKKYINK